MSAAESIISRAITLVSGRGGTGKTEVVSKVLAAAELIADREDSNGKILYAAPTGKAASVIKKRVGAPSFTIHQVLASYRAFKKEENNEWKFSETQVLAVDECSMVSLELFSQLLIPLLRDSTLTKIVLLGDHLQLPSVQPGNLMEDLYEALKTKDMSIDLTTNHRSEGHLIFENAGKIALQIMPVIDGSEGFFHIVPDNEPLSQGTCKLSAPSSSSINLCQEWKEKNNVQNTNKDMYWRLLKENRADFFLTGGEKSQIISFTNSHCHVLNQFGCTTQRKES